MGSKSVGVVSIQGDFACHLAALADLGISGTEVRTPEDLAEVDRLIIPGGESTTVGKLMERFGLGVAIKQRVAEGMPILGTCMGMIIMARDVEDHEQYRLGVLDISVRRNAFGAQVHSFEAAVETTVLDEPVMGVFIRAPIVTAVEEPAKVISTYQGQVVGVMQENRVGLSFHPELTADRRLHEWFCSL